MTHQPQLIPDPPSPDQAARDAEREEYLEKLRQHLQDPEFRAIEGFPIGEDEDILALSDPPYYTACPNPFLPEIIERWQAERAQIRGELGLPDDGESATSNLQSPYHREPFAADVSEGKNDPIYNAHSYHTKVPHKAVMRYILHYTDPGDIVFDGFCGTGMTGVAAQLCGDREAVQGLGYRVDEDGVVYDGGEAISRLGARKAALVDLSPAATFIAYNYNTPVDVVAFEREAKRVLREVEAECGWMYETWHPHCDHPQRMKARINYTVWSDVFLCPQCGEEMVFWDVAVDKATGYRKRRAEPLKCSACGMLAPLGRLDRAWVARYDPVLDEVIRSAKRIPVLINYSAERKKHEKDPDAEDLALIDSVDEALVLSEYPTYRMPEGDESRRNDDIGITHVHHFYTRRNLWAWAHLNAQARSSPDYIRAPLLFWLQSVALGQTLLNRYLAASFSQVNRYLKGTLYIAPFISEVSPRYALEGKIRATTRISIVGAFSAAAISSGSATQVRLPDSSVDYIFTDPPFGSNISYSDLNFLWESWLGVLTNNRSEAVVSRVQEKKLPDYQQLMTACFQECFRILKAGRWMTVEFHNSSNSVWTAIQEGIARAGFVVADVRVLDKKQLTMKQMTSTGAVKQDLIISAYKPRAEFERHFQAQAGSVEGAWDFVRQHLAQLPIVVEQDGVLEVVAERQDYLLFDRMVAFHIQRGATVPLSAAEFYAGLRERFPERDGMFFLPDQAPVYDRARLEAQGVAQLALFVSDEKSAVQWLRQQLDPAAGGRPQTYQELQPAFLRQLHQARHEALPELSEMLEQSFLQDEAGRWYVPDPSRASDLERLRRRALLREFREYTEGRGRLRTFRTEAVRAGFAEAWREREYAVIVRVAERLPERVLQEDPELLMYYDNATLRAG